MSLGAGMVNLLAAQEASGPADGSYTVARVDGPSGLAYRAGALEPDALQEAEAGLVTGLTPVVEVQTRSEQRPADGCAAQSRGLTAAA